jgi:aspartate/methionine/tyrosine aminotransferase
VENLKDIIKFAYDEKIVLMADEVYQVCVGGAVGGSS